MTEKVGDPVIYVDERGVERPALITATHGGTAPMLINVVFIHDDENQRDTYGRKIDRACSVSHESHPHANGRYWK